MYRRKSLFVENVEELPQIEDKHEFIGRLSKLLKCKDQALE